MEGTIMNRSNGELRKYMCVICGYIYDEAAGWPEDGISPGTRWEDVPPNWTCPQCGARKEDFEMVEIR
jgi:rubredoxin